MRYTTLLLFAVTTTGAFAQCGMTAAFSINVQCGSVSTTVQMSGGVAPYTIQFYGRQAGSSTFFPLYTRTILTGTTHNDNPPFQFTWSGTEQARITVTDVNGCTTTTDSPAYTPRIVPTTTITKTQDCAVGQTWIEVDWVYGGGAPQWGTYQLDFGPALPFLSNWTQTTPSNRYRLNTPVPAGSHTLAFPSCFVGGWQLCPETQSFFTSLSITPGDCGVNFRLRAALDGALPSGTIMTDGLRASNLIPTAQPYTGLGYTFVGSPTNVSITPATLTVTGNDAIVDWVVVELRSNTTTVVYSKPALLQADGDVIDTDGNTYLNFPVTAGSYYVALRHRNHLGVMTSTARSLTVDPSSTLIDFRSAASGVFGSTPMLLKGSVYCLWAGDATGNGSLQYTGANNDRDPILVAVGGSTPNNTLNNVYDRRDVNMDGVVRYTGANNDRDPILINVGSATPNNTRTQQLP